jgi:hypothetical protein
MKKNNIIYALLFMVLALTSCIKNEDILLKENLVEFDAATYNANGLGKTYPVVNRVPPYGFAIIATGTSANPLISRTSGTISFRVNVVGPQTAVDRVITYKVVPGETFTSGATAISAAVRNTHYTTSGTVTIPAMSSFGILTVTINNPGTALANDLLIVLELEGNAELLPSNADKQLGIWINRG